MNAPDRLPPSPDDPVNLDNCDREPIHTPGQIQPHGALLAFDAAGLLMGWSANVPTLLRFAPATGMPLGALPLQEPVLATLRECVAALGDDDGQVPPIAVETVVGGQEFDLVAHGHQHRVIAEFERREQSADEVAAFALKAHRAIDRLKRQKSIDALLQMAVAEVRAITGFDRVMAYRFRHDDSGEVVAEARLETLSPLLNMRYPASDIPAQARRLYTINTLRLIGDVSYAPVPLVQRPVAAGEPPLLDMSHGILRSVSPIHVEYLQNMGVSASMSISLVVAGRLWGMFACHHYNGPHRVPYSVRMACDVLAQVLSATVQTLDAREHAQRAEAAAIVRTRLFETLMHEDDVLRALARHEAELRQSLGAQALVITQQGKLLLFGDITPAQAGAIAHSLPTVEERSDLLQRAGLDDWPEEARGQIGKWVGLLGLRIDPPIDGWLVGLRAEQIETVRWAGKPEKELKVGPLGPRLTPRGSFEEWRETVRGTAVPWDESHLAIARQLLNEMHRVANTHHAEVERARTQLLAMLGHDLRDPLQSITMAAKVIEKGGGGGTEGQDGRDQKLSRRIQASSTRMQRLISQVLDMSRLESGLGLGMHLNPIDVGSVIEELVDESRTAYPGAVYELDVPIGLIVNADTDRIAQVVSNLVSNARHHGQPGEPIRIRLLRAMDESDGQHAIIQVANIGPPIEEALISHLFSPFKRQAVVNQRNRTGMGLGLHIAHKIVDGHGGTLQYRYEAPYVLFEVKLPLV
jgi:light-regulated signal transduction histidine kinase (bacteriophytochrome)